MVWGKLVCHIEVGDRTWQWVAFLLETEKIHCWQQFLSVLKVVPKQLSIIPPKDRKLNPSGKKAKLAYTAPS